MSIRLLLVIIITLTPCAASAQTAADGVRAILHGDYDHAARILAPLAERTDSPDALAQFFLGTLYEQGRGVAHDPGRACSLYLASGGSENPFGHQALILAQEFRGHLGSFTEQACPSTTPRGVVRARSRSGAQRQSSEPTDVPSAIVAFVDGDEGRAVEILRRTVERAMRPDPVADFFMATIYETGRILPGDITKACASYLRASTEDGPFRFQAERLSMIMRGAISRDALNDCAMLASLGYDHRFEPVTFALDGDSTISWDLRGATILRNGRETRHEHHAFGVHGGVFLPIQHTELLTGPTRSVRRHFIEVSYWLRGLSSPWTLTWRLFEVAGDALIDVTTHGIADAVADPRDGDPVDIRQFASISVNARGDVEWKVFSGPDARSGTIVTPEERVAAQQRDRARREADERVDWERQLDATRRPSLTYIDGGGCAHIFVYGWSPDRAEDITIRASKATLGLSTAAQTFDLAAPPAGLEVTVHVYDRAVRHWPYCTDVGMPESPTERTWRAVRGRITIQLAPPGDGTPASYQYRATIRIDGAEFSTAAGERVKQSRPIELTGVVGWMAG